MKVEGTLIYMIHIFAQSALKACFYFFLSKISFLIRRGESHLENIFNLFFSAHFF